MCNSCDWPGCGGLCGYDDQEYEMQVTEDVTCENCGKVYEFDGEALAYGRRGSYSYSYFSSCPICGKEQENEGNGDDRDDYDGD